MAQRFLNELGRDPCANSNVANACLTLSLRIGEALGLRWGDIDFDAKTLRVQRALQRVKEKG